MTCLLLLNALGKRDTCLPDGAHRGMPLVPVFSFWFVFTLLWVWLLIYEIIAKQPITYWMEWDSFQLWMQVFWLNVTNNALNLVCAMV